MCASGNLKTWYLSLGGTRGTHGDVTQRSVQVHVICANRPAFRRSTVGAFVSRYGAKPAVTRSRFGSIHRMSATIATFAVTTSPKRWTVGVSVAYAFSGTPSPTAEPEGKTGNVAAAGAAAASATATATSAVRLMRR